MKTVISLLLVVSIFSTGCSQSKKKTEAEREVGGPCEGCEAVFEYGEKQLKDVDTLPDYTEPGPKLKITGTIFKADGRTPAPDVILYIYHTDQNGEYSTRGGETGWARRHGYIRGWIKTNSKGEYTFYTLRPAAYPGRKDPAHIHPVIKEPGVKPYWIDEFLFDDDPLLTEEHRQRLEQRGGNGILKTTSNNNMLVATRNIILGKNVPDY
ncbi:MAG TPA: intradiol ring-cleavage dioxygenase [Chryseosolibacter sp.]|nr:intradiol ring-cleavage dioxygenase [Chryseosolibacter sp.]